MIEEKTKISIQNVYKSFGKGASQKHILRGVDLEIKTGEIMYIIGKSGSGKSVLLKNITALMQPDKGKILIDNENIYDMNEKELNTVRKKMGLVFQMAALFDSMSVYENIAFPLRRFSKKNEDEIDEIVTEKLRLVGLKKMHNIKPASLSGGMQKRVGIARAIAMEPEIVLYDEPTTGVDPILASAIDELISDLNQELNVTSVIISHDMKSTFRTADRIAMLYDGKFILTGDPNFFKDSSDPFVRQFIDGVEEGPIPIM